MEAIISKKYKIIITTSTTDFPRSHELSAAIILAAHFEKNITFIRPGQKKTPDINVSGIMWEIKSPKGGGKKTIENNLRTARRQSSNIIIDLRRSQLHQNKAEARIHHYLKSGPHRIKRLKIITKAQKIIDVL